jgi:predicted oxidoreductase
MSSRSLFQIRNASIFAALAMAVGVGCASDPPQSLKAQLAQTDTSIMQAEQSGAAQAGLPELQQAKDKRAKAQDAVKDRDYDVAMRFAQQAQLDAQFASRKSEAERANRTAAEVRKGHETLREETERNLDQPTTTTRP